MLNLFVINWNAEELFESVTPFIRKGWNVGYAFKNELEAKTSVEKLKPDVVVIYLNASPSRSRLAAKFIKATKLINQIPLIFVDGKTKIVKKIRNEFPNAKFTTSETLEATLLEFERDF